ncbi:hypothetical protein LPJ61_005386 [Coemansia biformis]|uniref:DM14 domain-containing protein n=1 Tax=Coemansia biformis TaxID=1286918 RepID=A0A9W7Y7I0_9FUNG|nr:hypothetical protein LPJ61_005386 [Coemansia biformis]
MYFIAGRRQRQTAAAAAAARSARPDAAPVDPAAWQPEDWALDDDVPTGDDECDDDGSLDDPGLLGELEALQREMGLAPSGGSAAAPAHTASQAAAAAAAADSGEAVASDEATDDEEAIEVTEADMNDPALLAALAHVTSEASTAAPAGASTAEQQPEPGPQARPATEPEPQARPKTEPDPVAVDGELLRALLEHQDEFKRAALAAKRQGDMPRAREMLVRMKEIQAAVATVQSGRALPHGFEIPAKPTESPQPVVPPQPGPDRPSVSTAAAGAQRATAAPSEAAPRHAGGPARQHATTEDHDGWAPEDIATSIEAMQARLTGQLAEAARLAEHFYKISDKPRALEFHRLKKLAAADLATLGSYVANGRQHPPPFLHRAVEWSEPAEQRRDIGAGQLQVAIGRVFSDGDLAATLGGQSDFYVQWELGWPRDKGTRGYTRTVRFKEFDDGNGSVDTGYTHSVDMVDRQNTRPLQRWVERARLTVELYKYMGIIWGSQLIGRAVLPLAALRTQSEAAAAVEIKAASDSLTRAGRPLPGGPVFVDAAARLRLSLSNSPEVIVRSERWIYIDTIAPPQVPLAPPTPRPLPKPEPEERPKSESDTQPKPETEEQQLPSPKQQQQQQQQPREQPGVAESTNTESVDDIAAKMDVMDGVVSNAALELELQLIPTRIKAAGDKDTVSELQDLEAAIKLRMSVVAAQVETGTLTIQAYMAAVAAEVAESKRWALAAKRGGRRDLAVRALQRVKAMQAELEEMAAAVEAADK